MATTQELIEVAWEPLPPFYDEVAGRYRPSSQSLAVACPCNEILYCGTRGPGKTDAQIFAFFRHVGEGYGTFWRGIILDTKQKSLEDIFERAKRWARSVWGNGIKVYESKGFESITFPDGEELLFRICLNEKQYWDYHGQEFPYIAWNELTKWKDSKAYDLFLSTNRSSFEFENAKRAVRLPDIPLVVFNTTNSYGIGFRWVKARFIDPAPYGHIVSTQQTVKRGVGRNARTTVVTRTRVAIFGSYKENPYLDDATIAYYESITNVNLRKSWLEGSWDISGGGMFDDLWAAHIHVKPRFVIPKTWIVDRAFDWGSSEPFSLGWFAVANGEEAVLPDGRVFCPQKNSVIQIGEWYGAANFDENVGLHLGVKAISDGLKNREVNMMQQRWIASQPWPGPADNQIRNVNETDTDTIEKKFLDQGIKWLPSDKAPGSRINGAQLFREMLENALTGVGPAFYVMEHCRATIAIVPNLPRDEDTLDDVDKNAIDHPWDMIRYKILRGVSRIARSLKFGFAS